MSLQLQLAKQSALITWNELQKKYVPLLIFSFIIPMGWGEEEGDRSKSIQQNLQPIDGIVHQMLIMQN